MSNGAAWLTAAEAARQLGISRPTLYAYVSRGLIRSQPAPGPSRERRYAGEDVERLRRRAEARHAPDAAAAGALQWGMPVLESAITLIDGQRLFYRGHDVVTLARDRSLEDVATLIWQAPFEPSPAAQREGARGGANGLRSFVPRAHALLAAAADRDPGALDLRPAAVARTGARILPLLARAAARRPLAPAPIHEALAQGWRVGAGGVDLIRMALVLCADHELNVSSFTARCVASAGSSPYAVVTAGLSALEGPRHGGASARVEAMLASLRDAPNLRVALAARRRRGEAVDGYGHPLYPEGDPRAASLLAALEDRFGDLEECRFLRRFVRSANAMTGDRPSLDFGLAAVARVLQLPPDAPLMLFAIARAVGWIGHAIEQYATGRLIRPRARYAGVAPPIG
jgi:citrate synthase